VPSIDQISVFELDMGTPDWRKTYGVPRFWAPDGIDWFASYPSPRGGNFLLEGYAEPPVMNFPYDWVDLGDEDLTRILDYAQMYLAFKEGVAEGTDNVKLLLQNFLEAAAERNETIRGAAIYREYMGEHRDETQGQSPSRVAGEKTGIRKKEGK
jgi:hypothetical protein